MSDLHHLLIGKKDWEKSGNGKGNLAGSHRIRGMDNADEDEGMDDTICFKDDDRADFVTRVGYGLPVLYF